jgi:hypothetical protein
MLGYVCGGIFCALEGGAEVFHGIEHPLATRAVSEAVTSMPGMRFTAGSPGRM